jgi:diapolycopene oxygenase
MQYFPPGGQLQEKTMNPKKAVIIGAGLGGLSAGIHLRNAGYAVEIYEKNAHVGGRLNVLRAEGFSFDLGPSILTLPHIFERLFTGAGKQMADYVKMQSLPVHWRNFFEDGNVIEFDRDRQQMELNNPSLAADDFRQLDNFLAYSRKLYAAADCGYFRHGLENLWQVIRCHGPLAALRDFDAFSVMNDGTRRHIRHVQLGNAINFFVKYVGSSAYQAPAILNLLPHVQFHYGLWYTEGGLIKLAEGLHRLATDIGVRIETNAEAVQLRHAGHRIDSVILKDGRVIAGDVIISNLEVIPTYVRLLGEDRRFLKPLDKFEPACSGLVIDIGSRKQYPMLAHHNFFFSNDPKKHFRQVFKEYKLPDDPTVYVVAVTRTDKSQAPAGCENIKILPHIPYIQDRPYTREDYLELRERVLLKLERMGLAGLRQNTVVEHMWTPDDIQKTYGSHRGAIYGVVSDWRKNLGFKAPRKSGKYANLYFVGGSVNPGGGMPMVVLSGELAAARIIHELQ